ncbi:hypothetical protein ANN_04118 [Periplaneta americana]|uniref:Uncharacterized protein n=1 Tax=Periplaneta americana TaxID=6978 RepID=A0ABQ8T989_PERAM|nr:hypothetical protein ANN_04118 [Periplaneta americana]
MNHHTIHKTPLQLRAPHRNNIDGWDKQLKDTGSFLDQNVLVGLRLVTSLLKLTEQPPVRTPEEMWDRVLDAWEEVTKNLDLFHNLVDSMPRRMRAVVDADVALRTGRLLLAGFAKEVQYVTPIKLTSDKVKDLKALLIYMPQNVSG